MKFVSKSIKIFACLSIVVAIVFQIAVPAGEVAAAGRCIDGIYGYGYTRYGTCVKNIQYMANAITHNWGGGWACSAYNNGISQQMSTNYISNDGNFGPMTQAKIKDIQRAVGCIKVDGIVGKQTWNTLCFYASSAANDTSSIYHQGYVAALNSGCKPSDTYQGPWPYSTY